ncbi:hypothetical protein K7X08_011987 [Anisodus acutangulus]|uniref:Uncharacterized protein n=1 Tax=Anisodus acutangulus TaxID=402998 RepID=A0A9Q1LCN3_9SOLA|nr:hypothetical protein K7X08_011987 [Anisodus acutangulus]
MGHVEGDGEEGLSAIQSELQRITAWLTVLDPPEIVLEGPILPPKIELFSTQPRVRTEPRVGYFSERDNVKEEDDDKLERESESESDSDDPLESARSAMRAASISPDEVDTVVATQWYVEQLRKHREHGTSGASSSSTPPTHAPLPPSVGLVIPLGISVEPTLVSEREPTG